jgi:hypothetical protein
MFERTQSWMHERDLFDDIKLEDGVAYAEAVHS